MNKLANFFQHSMIASTICLLLASPAIATVAETGQTTVHFKKSPGQTVVVKRSGEKVQFYSCSGGNKCQIIGRESGYTKADLQDRFKHIRKKLWKHRLLTIPLATTCSAILAGAVGWYMFSPFVDLANEMMNSASTYIDSAVESQNLGEALLAPAVGIGATMTAGTLYSVAFTYASAYAAAGAAFGFPASWLATKVFLPNYSVMSTTLRDGLNIEEHEVTTNMNYEKYLSSLRIALDF